MYITYMYSVHIPQVSYLKFRHVRLASVFNNDKEYIYNVHLDVHWPRSQVLYMRGEGLVHTACTCAGPPWVTPEKCGVVDIIVYVIIMCYHEDPGMRKQCVPGPLLSYIGPGNEARCACTAYMYLYMQQLLYLG